MGSQKEILTIKSSLVEQFIYDPNQQSLEVIYKKGKVRTYRNIPERDYNRIITAKSIGRTLLRYLDERQTNASWITRLKIRWFDR